MKNISIFIRKFSIFLEVIFSVYLNRRVFVMIYTNIIQKRQRHTIHFHKKCLLGLNPDLRRMLAGKL